MAGVNDALMNRGIRHAVYLDHLATTEVDRMVTWMDKHLWPDIRNTLDARLASIARTGNVGGAWRTTRYREMLAALDGQISAGMGIMSKDAAARLTRLGAIEAQWAKTALADAVPLSVVFRAPSLPTIRAIVTSRPMQGRFLKDWYAGVDGALRSSIRQQINVGLAAGESVPAIAGRIVGIKGAEAGFMGNSTRAFTRRNVRAVVRTTTNHISNAAREATYAENADIIKEVQWVSTLDARTTDICMSLDGQRFKIEQGQRPPAHHQCRSTTVPITKSWKELGIKNAKDKRIGGRVYRDVKTGMNGVAPTRINYGEWLQGQPHDVQDYVLGQQQAALFRSGRVRFPRFYTDEGRRLSITELARLEGIPAPVVEAKMAAILKEPITPPAFDPSAIRGQAFAEHGAAMEKSAAAWEELEALKWRQQGLIQEYNAEYAHLERSITNRNRYAEGSSSYNPWRHLTEAQRQTELDFITHMREVLAEAVELKKKWPLLEDKWKDASSVVRKELHAMMAHGGAGVQMDLTLAGEGHQYMVPNVRKPVKAMKPTAPFRKKTEDASAFLESMISRDAVAGATNEAEWAVVNKEVAKWQRLGVETNESREAYARLRALEAGKNGRVKMVVIQRSGNNANPFALNESNHIVIQSKPPTAVHVHEMSHMIEDRFAKEQTEAFLKYRARLHKEVGANMMPGLEPIAPVHYNPGVMGYEDFFFQKYSGRRYFSRGRLYGTEIMSVYSEFLYADPALMMLRDPEGFDFMLNLWRGIPIQKHAWFKALPPNMQAWVLEPIT